ncbi:MAG: pantoate--beta-alanine ligase [Ginsengibacter sp.]
MKIFKEAASLVNYLEKRRLIADKISFVPTMGALHAGHLSLIRKSAEVADLTICSIFVNPLQFNSTEDFRKYPKTIEKDMMLLENEGCDVLFLPDEKEIYPDKSCRKKHYDLEYLETILEGKFRPGHFQGVCTVVERLLKIVRPDFLLLGQKDYQQCMIIEHLLLLMNQNIQLIICPIVREESGLAMSSRNFRLSSSERKTASAIYRNLCSIKENLSSDNFRDLQKQAVSDLEKMGLKIEYLELAKTNTLELIDVFEKGEEVIILIAVFLEGVRLIDNVIIE